MLEHDARGGASGAEGDDGLQCPVPEWLFNVSQVRASQCSKCSSPEALNGFCAHRVERSVFGKEARMKILLRSNWRWPAVAALAMIGGLALALTQIVVNSPLALSEGGNADKPKMQRAGNGLLIAVYGDSPAGAQDVYEVKAAVERKARDIFVRTCMPGADRSCDDASHWSAAKNISNSALKTSITTDWRGTSGDPAPYPGDIDKPNAKMSGPVMVITWISKYCPDGDLSVAGTQPSVQRAIQYAERDFRVIPFSCLWIAYSTNHGTSFSAPRQLTTGLRDAIQDFSAGGYDSKAKKGQFAFSWQEDPQGLLLGEAEGPGDGAAGAKVNGGTDIWYSYATVDLSVPSTPSDDFVLSPPVRLSDNWQGKLGLGKSTDRVIDGAGLAVDPGQLETGQAGASRANISLAGTTAVVAYEETKAADLPTVQGKFVRYHVFDYRKPVYIGGDASSNHPAGCVISDPLKNARRARVLTQSTADAGPGGIQLALLWREGIFNQGGPADIVVRRGLGGVRPEHLVPVVDSGCFTSSYGAVKTLTSERAENISSNSPAASDLNLLDDTETYVKENGMAHRGVLRGPELWIGYSYTSDMDKLWAQQDNYNFWVRKYTLGSGWDKPQNLTQVTDTRINVREPRLFGTPKSASSGCASGNPADPTTTDPTLCQNTAIVYLAWGTQTNLPPDQADQAEDLGIFITFSDDGGQTFRPPLRYSTAKGSLFDDDEAAYESQIVTRPDGTRFYGAWNRIDLLTGATTAEFASGELVDVAPPPEPAPEPVPAPEPAPEPVPEPPAPPTEPSPTEPPVSPPVDTLPPPTPDSPGGCAIARAPAPVDPALWLLVAFGLMGITLRRARDDLRR
jgi:hypothetical protein